ncbi:MAG: DUF1273 family protein [Clostridia bacterium]|nr:DUF1273 family protein [Clostridia bacterium]
MKVTFCGHGDVYYGEKTKLRLHNCVRELIEHGATDFLIGGYGNFDCLATHTVNSLKLEFPYIKAVLVVPYLNRNFQFELYDYSIYPPLENVPERFAILKRNQWLVDNADILVACVRYRWGGAAKTLEYAKKKNREIKFIP